MILTMNIQSLANLIATSHEQFGNTSLVMERYYAPEECEKICLEILKNTRDFLKAEKTATSCNFNSILVYTYPSGKKQTLNTVITIGMAADGSDNLTFIEKKADEE